MTLQGQTIADLPYTQTVNAFETLLMQNLDEQKRAQVIDQLYRAPKDAAPSSMAPRRSGISRAEARARIAARGGG